MHSRLKLSSYSPNSEVDWLSSDSEELFEKNLIDRYVELSDNGWIEHNFTYKFNSQGFRCGEFTTTDAIAFFGCSFTLGVGLPVENTFASLICNEAKVGCYNFGQAASSSDTAFRLAYYWLPIIKPKVVILMKPGRYRKELILKDSFEKLMPTTPVKSKLMPFYLEWCYTPDNSFLNAEKNLLAIQNICSNLGIKFLSFDSEFDIPRIPGDFARDLLHPGILSNRQVAENILRVLN